jgi:cobalamin biosynthesis Mg chelatase CobN
LTVPLKLSHNYSVDLHVDQVASQAKLVVARVMGGRGYWPYGIERLPRAVTELETATEPGVFAPFDCPVLQVIFAGGDVESWRRGTRGLDVHDIAMNVSLPEIDGRILSRAISFKSTPTRDPLTEADLIVYDRSPTESPSSPILPAAGFGSSAHPRVTGGLSWYWRIIPIATAVSATASGSTRLPPLSRSCMRLPRPAIASRTSRRTAMR